jgi:hypothetical protein
LNFYSILVLLLFLFSLFFLRLILNWRTPLFGLLLIIVWGLCSCIIILFIIIWFIHVHLHNTLHESLLFDCLNIFFSISNFRTLDFLMHSKVYLCLLVKSLIRVIFKITFNIIFPGTLIISYFILENFI